jgi:hypothetical protein
MTPQQCLPQDPMETLLSRILPLLLAFVGLVQINKILSLTAALIFGNAELHLLELWLTPILMGLTDGTFIGIITHLAVK